jgi:hypothetical protein
VEEMKGIPLTCELVPTGTWGSNLRSLMPPSGWNRLRKFVYERADNKCELCGQDGFSQNRKWAVEAHEIWLYDDVKNEQSLIAVQSLCPRCHLCKHLGRSLKVGAAEQVRKHMREINGWDEETQQMYEQFVFAIHKHRSRFRWTVNIDMLEDYVHAGAIKQIDFDKSKAKLKGGATEND